ncbi:hypothetical protein E2R51_14910 [Jeotgalibacillus sp. S-D1]|uniref:hypothetical protein n=1 Tax=Jeotgalibacillus sp. S-D1 TaxID=2552189 RepID=UPI0010599999|nr:hypothetical protein [Jeotgalibacillus sp. S-D1]TDL31083.1 hypothetical protein E2R51_14910 [Jeotgalibacillus sp. S-D1]
MKSILISAVTLVGLITANYLTALLGFQFMDTAFLTGLISTFIIYYFSSTGGFTSNQVSLQVQSETGTKVDVEKRNFYPSLVFYTALIYTAVCLIGTFVYYKDYFI